MSILRICLAPQQLFCLPPQQTSVKLLTLQLSPLHQKYFWNLLVILHTSVKLLTLQMSPLHQKYFSNFLVIQGRRHVIILLIVSLLFFSFLLFFSYVHLDAFAIASMQQSLLGSLLGYFFDSFHSFGDCV